ncbi:MAG: ABC transporter ATP-binding protein [Cyclobacteriaceae bacterium]|nr:ABC transporter ATP-binding protein [Cyclobacteriaceae bacterium]
MISISSLTKTYGREPVVNISNLTIRKGESFGLVGNNGAGKTTLFRMLLDLIRPTQGTVTLNGKNVQGQDDWKKYVGSYLDESFLIPYLTPDEYFKFVGMLHQYSDADLHQFLQNFEELFNDEITGKQKRIGELSKGNLKKVGIAAAFIGNPAVVILDEPFENLDPTSQIRLKRLLQREKESRAITYLISSHDLNHVTEICGRIVILEKGMVVKDIVGDDLLPQLEEYFKA